MKQNFSSIEFMKLHNMFNGNIFNVRFNKAGNISLDVKNLDNFNIDPYLKRYYSGRSYVFYKTKDGILIRCISKLPGGRVNVFPLNMNAKARVSERYWWNDKFHWSYGVKWSCFENVDDAIVYFIYYLYKYHNIIDF